MSQQETMRLVAELVDKYSVPLSQMQRAVTSMVRSAKGGHEEAGKAAREHAKHLKELHERLGKVRETAVELVTPALAAMGIAGVSAAEAIKSVVEASRHFGEVGRALEMVHNRSGMSVAAIREAKELAEHLGLSSEDMAKGLSSMGEFLDQTAKKMPEAMNKWNSMPLAFEKIGKRLSQVPRDVALGMVLDFLPTMTDKAQKRQLLAMLGLPEDIASFTQETLNEARQAAAEWQKNHPLNAKAAEDADKAWVKLGATFRGLRSDLENMTSPSIIHGVDTIREFISDPAISKGFGEVIEHAVKAIETDIQDIRSLIELAKKIIGGPDVPFLKQTPAEAWDKYFNKKSPNQRPKASGVGPADPLFTPTSFGGFGGKSDTQSLFSESVKQGVLAAFREWAAGGAGGAGGFTNAAFHPDGGGTGPRFGSKEFPRLPNGDGRGDDVPAGSGPPSKGGASGNRREVAKIVADEWQRAGMSKEGVAGLMANINDESRFNPNLRHADQPRWSGEAHFAHGLYQEGGAEWNNYAAWLKKNHPGADWRDPRLQSRFAAENLKKNYPRTWQKMLHGNRFQAGAAYVDGYLKPAAVYRHGRMNKYLRGGVAPLEQYTGPADKAEDSARGASLRDHIRRRGSVLQQGKQSGMFGGEHKVTGDASVKIDLNGFPKGTRTAATATGMFKEVHLNRGRAMPMSSMDG